MSGYRPQRPIGRGRLGGARALDRISSEEHPAVPISNRLLVALAQEDLDRLRPHLEPVLLPHKQSLLNANTPIDHVYFPQEGMVSLVQPLENGAMIEVGMIGNEGFVGVPVLLGTDTSPLEAMVQIPGSALRMQASEFREEAGRRTAFLGLLLRHVQALHVQVSLTAACNGRHTLPERLARWLLMARDRATSDQMPLGHEFLSMMLGVRRAGVTVGVGTLKAAGLISNTHGQVAILDRQGLEMACCECYRTVRNEYQRLVA
jgi:CRP-like cAMP-binding protein